jgi:hypothetical protein
MARRALISKILLAAISPLAILVALEFALGFAAVDRPLLHFSTSQNPTSTAKIPN